MNNEVIQFEEYNKCPKDWDSIKITGNPMMDNFQNSQEVGIYFEKINQDILWIIIKRYGRVLVSL